MKLSGRLFPEPLLARALMRRFFIILLAVLILTLAVLVVPAAAILTNASKPRNLTAYVTVITAGSALLGLTIIATSFWIGARLTRIARTARAHNGLLCIACMYPMPRDATRCSECGRAQDMHETMSSWWRFAHPRRLAKPDPADQSWDK